VTFGPDVLIFVAAAVLSYALLLGLMPFLARHAVAKPNARSSHTTPTPQGGGIAIIIATIIASAVAAMILKISDITALTIVFLAAAGLALVGAIDDRRPMEAGARLILQAAAVAAVIAALPAELRIVPAGPWWLDRAFMLIGGIWLINVVNFMDGIDWMTVAEIVPVTAGLVLLGWMGALPVPVIVVAAALCGAVAGFAPFNKPVARLFLGDVGSLPIGLLLGWMLVLLAGRGHFAAAILLPLYYLGDATITLMRRIARGEPITQAHRNHYYQQALDGGFSIYQIVGRVFALNFLLAALAVATIAKPSPAVGMVCLVAGVVSVNLVLWSFARARK
jgi:UDP-N-acetylmuramyl pentapeptide phosphotransferase/UDP-N-acetylglucosamine-1-phosphate transferase